MNPAVAENYDGITEEEEGKHSSLLVKNGQQTEEEGK